MDGAEAAAEAEEDGWYYERIIMRSDDISVRKIHLFAKLIYT